MMSGAGKCSAGGECPSGELVFTALGRSIWPMAGCTSVGFRRMIGRLSKAAWPYSSVRQEIEYLACALFRDTKPMAAVKSSFATDYAESCAWVTAFRAEWS